MKVVVLKQIQQEMNALLADSNIDNNENYILPKLLLIFLPMEITQNDEAICSEQDFINGVSIAWASQYMTHGSSGTRIGWRVTSKILASYPIHRIKYLFWNIWDDSGVIFSSTGLIIGMWYSLWRLTQYHFSDFYISKCLKKFLSLEIAKKKKNHYKKQHLGIS